MLDVRRKVLHVPVTEKMFSKTIEKLKKEFKSILTGGKEDLCENLYMDFGDYKDTGIFYAPVFRELYVKDRLFNGDIFLGEKSEQYYIQIPKDRKSIDVTCVSRVSEIENELDKFCDIISEAIFPLVRSAQLNWIDDRPISEKYKLLKGDMPVFTPTEEDYRAVTELESTKSRELLAKISAQPSVFLNDLGDENERMMIGGLIWKMEQLGLVSRDYILFCHQTGQQINRVESISAIEDAAQQGFKCFHCGRLISQERIDQCIRITDYGKYITRGSYWLAVRLLGLLKGAGLMGDDILVDYHEGEVDIIDLYFNCDDKLSLVEIKVAPYNMTDAYLFYNKMKIYRPDEVMLISLSPIKEGLKDYFSHVMPSLELIFLDNLNELPKVINIFLEKKRLQYIQSKLSCFASATYFDLAPLVVSSFFGVEAEVEEEEEAIGDDWIKLDEDEEKPGKSKQDDDMAGEDAKLVPDIPDIEEFKPDLAGLATMEDMDEIDDISIMEEEENISETKEMALDVEEAITGFSDELDMDEVEVRSEEPVLTEEEVSEVDVDIDVLSKIDDLGEPSEETAINDILGDTSMVEDDSFSFDDAMDFLNEGLDDFSFDISLDDEDTGLEVAPDVIDDVIEEPDDIGEIEEQPPEEPVEDDMGDIDIDEGISSMDSMRELIAQEVVDSFSNEGVVGRGLDNIKASLAPISDMEGVMNTVLASKEGLIVCHTGEESKQSEVIAAVSVEFERRLSRAIAPMNIDKPQGVMVEATQGKVLTSHSSDFVLGTLIAEDSELYDDKVSERMSEIIERLEGDRNNSEYVLGSSLEVLKENTGIIGAIIGSGEGLVVMSSLPEGLSTQNWIAYLFHLYQATEDAVFRLGMGELDRYIFKTRLEGEDVNITCLKNGEFILAGVAKEETLHNVIVDLKATGQAINTLLV